MLIVNMMARPTKNIIYVCFLQLFSSESSNICVSCYFCAKNFNFDKCHPFEKNVNVPEAFIRDYTVYMLNVNSIPYINIEYVYMIGYLCHT